MQTQQQQQQQKTKPWKQFWMHSCKCRRARDVTEIWQNITQRLSHEPITEIFHVRLVSRHTGRPGRRGGFPLVCFERFVASGTGHVLSGWGRESHHKWSVLERHKKAIFFQPHGQPYRATRVPGAGEGERDDATKRPTSESVGWGTVRRGRGKNQLNVYANCFMLLPACTAPPRPVRGVFETVFFCM